MLNLKKSFFSQEEERPIRSILNLFDEEIEDEEIQQQKLEEEQEEDQEEGEDFSRCKRYK